MSNTISNVNLRAQLWEKELIREVQSDLWVTRRGMMGTGADNVLQTKTELAKEAGDKITIGLRMKLTGGGIVGDNEVVGHETDMIVHDFSFKIEQLRKGIRLKGRMDEKRAVYNMRKEARDALRTWLVEEIEQDIFAKLCGVTARTFANTPTAPSSARRLFGGAATSTNTITAADKFAPVDISKAKTMAKTIKPRLEPLRINGNDRYVIIIHDYQAFDLKQNPVWNAAQRDAGIRGETNPIFSGALGMWDGVIVHTHENIAHYTNWGTGSVEGATAIFVGRQAGMFGYGGPVIWHEETKDAGNKQAFYCGRIFGCQKAKFNGQDRLISIQTAAKKPF